MSPSFRIDDNVSRVEEKLPALIRPVLVVPSVSQNLTVGAELENLMPNSCRYCARP